MDSSTIYGIGLAILTAAGAVMTVISAVEETRVSKMVKEDPEAGAMDRVVNFVKHHYRTILTGTLTIAMGFCTFAMFKQAAEITAMAAAAATPVIGKYKPQILDLVTKKVSPDGITEIDANETNTKKYFKDDFSEIFEATPFEMIQHELDANKTLSLSNNLSIYDLHKMYGIPDKANPFRVNHDRGFSIEKMFDCYQYPWLGFDYVLMNDPSKGNVDYNVNDGKPYYLIEYSVPVENDILE